MSYDYGHIVRLVLERLRLQPTIRLCAIARDLQVSRHTIRLALRKQGVGRFSTLKAQFLNDVIRAETNRNRPDSVKEAAHRVGYSSGASLARKTRRDLGASPTVLRRQRENR